MPYQAKTYSHLIGMEGFSKQLLENHFTLYQGYVTNTNKLADTLSQMLKDGKTGTPEYAELKRRFGWEFNGMRLHEFYFDNLGGKEALGNKTSLHGVIEKQFGSFANWEVDFKAAGSMRGIGWTLLYLDGSNGSLYNDWINEHDMGHLAGCTPIVVLDVFEHAYMIDYGLKRGDYITAFMKNINWKEASSRFDKAQH
ncbi:MAG TPA: superoxide dismutase [Candidatus Acidoferrales bacterium]|nr:superoxide dismutase [Candidatus Acidoferrales bacterium]